MKRFTIVKPVLLFAVSLIALAVVFHSGAAFAQFGDLLGMGLGKIPGIDIGMKQDSPITTSFDDALTSVPYFDDYPPRRVFPVCEMPGGPNDGYIVQPGVYRMEVWSYCLHAGTYGPSKGDGYLLAPLKGKRAKIIQNILDRSIDHPDIEQHDIQTLIWAILARTKISEMNPEMQLTAAKLLTEKELLELQGGVLGLVPADAWGKVFGDLPPGVREIYEAEAKLREMMTVGNASYEELERVAVLVGEPPGEKGPEIPRGRWSIHPDGYFVRFFPHGYSDMHMEMMLPESCAISRDTKGRIAEIWNSRGEKLTVNYDDSATPLKFKGAKDSAGYSIASFVLTRPERLRPWRMEVKEWKANSWTIAGNPGKGSPEGSSGAYGDSATFAKYAAGFGAELDAILKQAPKGSVDANFKRDIFDATMLGYALKGAIGYTPRDIADFEEFPKWDADYDTSAYTLNEPMRDYVVESLAGDDSSSVAVRLAFDATADRLLRVFAPATYGEVTQIPSAQVASGGASEVQAPGFFGGFDTMQFAARQGIVFAGGRTLPEFNGGGVASPANRGKQRLAISKKNKPRFGGSNFNEDDDDNGNDNNDNNNENKESPGKDGFDRLRKVLDWFGMGNNATDLVASGPGMFAANQIGMAIPNYGMGKVIDFNVNTYEQASNALAGDPPNPDYKNAVELPVIKCPILEPVAGIPQARIDAINAFVAASFELTASCKAASQALDNHGGALLANDAEWIYTHRDSILHYKHTAGVAYLKTADSIETLIAELRSEGITDIDVTRENFVKYQQRLRQSGWTDGEKEIMRSQGYTDAQMTALLQYRIGVNPDEAAGSIMNHYEWLAVALRGVGVYLTDLPAG